MARPEDESWKEDNAALEKMLARKKIKKVILVSDDKGSGRIWFTDGSFLEMSYVADTPDEPGYIGYTYNRLLKPGEIDDLLLPTMF